MASLTLCGLESKPKLNGRTVFLQEYHRSKNRWEVVLDGDLPMDDLFKIAWCDSWHAPLDKHDSLRSKDEVKKPTFKETFDVNRQKHKVAIANKDMIVLDSNWLKIGVFDEEGNLISDLTEEHLENAWRKSFPLLFQKHPSDNKTLGVRTTHLRLKEDQSVEQLRRHKVEMSVNGAHKKPALDGQIAALGPFTPSKQVWEVRPDDRSLWDVKVDGSPCPVLLRSAEIKDDSSGVVCQDPVQVRKWDHVSSQKALYANVPFESGVVICSDTPIMHIRDSDIRSLKWLWRQFQHLPENEHDVVLELCRGPENLWRICEQDQKKLQCHDLEEADAFKDFEQNSLFDAWNTYRAFDHNSFRHDFKEGWFLYLALSRINHSCRPNAVLRDPKAEVPEFGPDVFEIFSKHLIAVRSIAEGEEITISYLSQSELLEPLAERQRRLSRWGFKCSCSRCMEDEQRDALRSFSCKAAACTGIHGAGSCSTISACDVCGTCAVDADKMLSDEKQHVASYFEFIRSLSPENKLSSPDQLAKILRDASESGLAHNHWIVCRTREVLSLFYQNMLEPGLVVENLEPIVDLHYRVLGHHDSVRMEILAEHLAKMGRLADAFRKYSDTLAALKQSSPEEPAGRSSNCDRVRQKLRDLIAAKTPE